MKSKLSFVLLVAICSLFATCLTGLASASASDTAYINVAVATLWKEPGFTRPLDQPSLTNPVDIRKWTQNMTPSDKLWLTSNLETQALYGQKVKILDEKGGWAKVAIPEQPTPRQTEGYPGWLPKVQLAQNPNFINDNRPFIVVKNQTTWLYNGQDKSSKFMEISFNTRLPIVSQTDTWVCVYTPTTDKKWIEKSAVAVYNSELAIPKPTPTDLVNTARTFVGLPYLWSGLSGFGFDCSGFTYSIYKFYGITIPRDSSVQALKGDAVDKNNLQPGDLLFFAYNNGKGRIHHVAMYIGNGEIIHSPKSGRTVEILSMNTSPLYKTDYAPEYAGARRYLK